MRLIGSGMTGRVFEAEDPELGRRVAIKVLSGGALATAERLERFRREREALARLRHPHLLSVHSGGSWQGSPYLVTELLPGRTLRHVLDQGGLGLAERVALARAVVSGVAALHAIGLLHRDLKPENVLMDEAGQPKVADLGLAIAGDDQRLTRSGALVGTPDYMAPEALRGELLRAPTSDVYSLGVLLFELLTGRTPHPAESLAGLMEARIEQPRRDPRELDPAIPTHLAQLCLKAMSGPPEERFADAGAFLAAFDPASPPAPVDRRRRPMLLAGLVAAPLLLGLAALLTTRSSEPRPTPPTQPAPSLAAAPSLAPTASPAPAPATAWRGAVAEVESLLAAEDPSADDRLRQLEDVPLASWPAARAKAIPLAEGLVWAAGRELGWALADGSTGRAEASGSVVQLIARGGDALAVLGGAEPGLHRLDLERGALTPTEWDSTGVRLAALAGDVLVVARDEVELLRLDGARLGSCPMCRPGESVVALAPSHEGRSIAAIVGSAEDPGSSTSFLVWWSPGGDGSAMRRQVPTAGALAFAPGGELLCAGTSDGTLLLFEGPRQKPRTIAVKPLTRVRCLAWSPAGRILYLGMDDVDSAKKRGRGGVIAWDMERNLALRSFGQGQTLDLQVASDGRTLVRTSPSAVELWTTAGDRARLARGG